MQCVRYSQLQTDCKDRMQGEHASCSSMTISDFHLQLIFINNKHHEISCAQSPRLGLLRQIPIYMKWHKLGPLHNDNMHHLLYVHKLCGLPPPLSWESLLSMLSPQQSPHHMCPTWHVKLFVHSRPGHLCQMVCKVCPRKHHTPRVGMCAMSPGQVRPSWLLPACAVPSSQDALPNPAHIVF